MLNWKDALIFLLVIIVGFAFFYQQRTWSLPNNLIKKTVWVDGYVADIPKHQMNFSQFDFSVVQFNGEKRAIKIKLSWDNPDKNLLAGQRCLLPVSLKPSHGLINPDGFDYKQWLLMQEIFATGNVVNRENPKCFQEFSAWFFITRLRQTIQQHIEHSIADPKMQALISALAVGSHTDMQAEQWLVLQNTGTNHLMAISGLHVGIIVGLMYFIANFLWRLSENLLRIFPAKKAAAVAAIIIALIYGLISGFSLPTERAVIMIIVLMIFEIFTINISVFRRLIVAALIVIFWQPLAITQASFWLSFASVGFICYGMIGNDGLAKWRHWLRIQWSLFIGLLPITLYFFQKISLTMFVANAIAIPWVGFLIVPLSLFAALIVLIIPVVGDFLFYCLGYLMQPLWWLLTIFAGWPHAVWNHSILNIWIFFASLLAVILILAPKGWPLKSLSVIFILPLLLYQLPKPKIGEVWVTVLDVGQGLATVIQTTNHILIYDTGPKIPTGFDAGNDIVVPYLRRLSVNNIDRMIISHGDDDHIGGAESILQTFPVQELFSNDQTKLSAFHPKPCFQGQNWRWDNVNFKILYPIQGQPYLKNNSSCVLIIHTKNQAILLPGDIEEPAESILAAQSGTELKADILIAPHHGSKTSSSWPFLKVVQPKTVIISSGFYNRFHFPSPIVLQRYHDLNVTVLSTAEQGAIQVKLPIASSNEVG